MLTIPPSAYADDLTAPLKISNSNETQQMSEIFLDLKIATGLSINPDKTLIITPNPSQISEEAKSALQTVGSIVDSVDHLGLRIASSYERSHQLSWENAILKLEIKIKRIGWQIGTADMLARKMLISALLQSTINHVIRVFPPSLTTLKKLDDLLLNSLWSRTFRGRTYGHTLIAKDRLHLPINKGGLGWILMSSRAITCFFSSLFHTIRYILSHPLSTLSKMCPINSNALFRQSSSSNLVHLKAIATSLFHEPQSNLSYYFDNFSLRLSQLEKHPDFFHYGSIQFSPLADIGCIDIRHSLHRITNSQMCEFPYQASIAYLIDRSPPSQNPSNTPDNICAPKLKLNPEKITNLPTEIKNKLAYTINSLNTYCQTSNYKKVLKNISRFSPENSFNFIYRAVFINNSFLTIPFYKMEQAFPTPNSIPSSKIPPAYHTRKRDKAPLPSSEQTFLSAYQFVHKASLPSYTKSFIINMLNRTAPSKRTLYRCKIVSDEICIRCNVVSDNYHIIAECSFAYMIITALTKYLTQKNVEFTENTFCFFAPISSLSNNFNSQIMHILSEVFRRAYTTVDHERLYRWSGKQFFAQIRSILLSIINVRRYAGWAYKEVASFENFFSSYIDKIHKLNPQNTGHFRAIPTYKPSPASFSDPAKYTEFVANLQRPPRLISV